MVSPRRSRQTTDPEENPNQQQQPHHHATEQQFEFVFEQGQRGARSHAMREFWRQRHRRLAQEREAASHTTTFPRQLLPNILPPLAQDQDRGGTEPSSSSFSNTPQTPQGEFPIDDDVNLVQMLSSSLAQRPSSDPRSSLSSGTHSEVHAPGIPLQALAGLNCALSTSQADPFDVLPIKLTAQHQKLLHHCTCSPVTSKMRQ